MDPGLYEHLTTALVVGALVGIERGWKQRDRARGSRAAGTRAFALAGLLAVVTALVDQDIGAAAYGARPLASEFFHSGNIRTSQRSGRGPALHSPDKGVRHALLPSLKSPLNRGINRGLSFIHL